jgi:hypothetical protein
VPESNPPLIPAPCITSHSKKKKDKKKKADLEEDI